jgi:hypothetical protein
VRGQQAKLSPVIENDDRTPSHLAPRSRSGGDRDDGRDRSSDPRHAAFYGGIGEQRTIMSGGEGDCFRKIDRRPSAYCNESIAREGTIGLDTLSHGPLGGIRRRPVEHAESDRTPELRRHAVDQTCRPDPLVRHDERTTKTDALAFLPEQSYGTEIELDRRDVGDDCDCAFS